MCGIAGVIGSDSGIESLKLMINSMHHRGPDDSGIYHSDGVAIGMTRLAIIDLSPLGHQPMKSHCGRYWIVYNGECYNYKDMKAQLELEGEKFISNSDTEVVLQAYAKWGANCLNNMNGMFAFAIWDTFEKELFAARDHFGIKPFYFHLNERNFVFSSEIKTLLKSTLVPNELDPEAIAQYFAFGHIQQPLTILKHAKALSPGCYLKWKRNNLSIHSYWSLKPGNKPIFSYEEAKGKLLLKMRKAVRQQMISDRPLGLFLSGGLDSASVLASMAFNQVNSHTFTLGFEENVFTKNEEREARELADYFGANHESITLDTESVLNDIPRFFQALDQPSIDGLNTYLVSKYASRSMTVALSGLGGDELFAGYSRHALLMWKSRHRFFQSFSRLIPDSMWMSQKGDIGNLLWKARAFGESDDVVLNYAFARTLEVPGCTPDYLSEEVNAQIDFKKLYCSTYRNTNEFNGETLNEILRMDLYGFMSSQLLRDMDATSMANSLEVRFPLIDYEFVEFAFGLPENYKLTMPNKRPKGEGSNSYSGSGAKKILLDTMKPFLPKGFEDRSKNGFKLPLQHWIKKYRTEEINSMVLDNKDEWEKYLNANKVERSLKSFKEGKISGNLIWKLLCFAMSIRLN